QGSARWKDDGTPPGITSFARVKYSAERWVRLRSCACSRSISELTRAGSMCGEAGTVADMRKHLLRVTVDRTAPGARWPSIERTALGARPGTDIPPVQRCRTGTPPSVP